jgi:hypothetical protein
MIYIAFIGLLARVMAFNDLVGDKDRKSVGNASATCKFAHLTAQERAAG